MMRLALRGADGTAKALHGNNNGSLKVLATERVVLYRGNELATDSNGNIVLLSTNDQGEGIILPPFTAEYNLNEFRKIYINLISYVGGYDIKLYEHRFPQDYGVTSLMTEVVLAENEYEKRILREVSLFSGNTSIRFESSNKSANTIQYVTIWGER